MNTAPVPAGSRAPSTTTDFELVGIMIDLYSAVDCLSRAVEMLAAYAPADVKADTESAVLNSKAGVDAAFDKMKALLA